jgi:hypothetical protein
MAINNSIFKNEQEIGGVVSKWKNIYNKKHSRAITTIYKRMYLCVYTAVKQIYMIY